MAATAVHREGVTRDGGAVAGGKEKLQLGGHGGSAAALLAAEKTAAAMDRGCCATVAQGGGKESRNWAARLAGRGARRWAREGKTPPRLRRS
ncbi:hypothetical protein SESBI_20604 [Sesbania bispinosa]|nr:hypothetical protein SESBI_20604 [Sesbania bispinosa]